MSRTISKKNKRRDREIDDDPIQLGKDINEMIGQLSSHEFNLCQVELPCLHLWNRQLEPCPCNHHDPNHPSGESDSSKHIRMVQINGRALLVPRSTKLYHFFAENNSKKLIPQLKQLNQVDKHNNNKKYLSPLFGVSHYRPLYQIFENITTVMNILDISTASRLSSRRPTIESVLYFAKETSDFCKATNVVPSNLSKEAIVRTSLIICSLPLLESLERFCLPEKINLIMKEIMAIESLCEFSEWLKISSEIYDQEMEFLFIAVSRFLLFATEYIHVLYDETFQLSERKRIIDTLCCGGGNKSKEEEFIEDEQTLDESSIVRLFQRMLYSRIENKQQVIQILGTKKNTDDTILYILPLELSMCCRQCGKIENIKRCTKCRFLYYCSIECQRLNWDRHKNDCEMISSFMQKKVPFYCDNENDLIKCD